MGCDRQVGICSTRVLQFPACGSMPPFAKGGMGGFLCQRRPTIPQPPLRTGLSPIPESLTDVEPGLALHRSAVEPAYQGLGFDVLA